MDFPMSLLSLCWGRWLALFWQQCCGYSLPCSAYGWIGREHDGRLVTRLEACSSDKPSLSSSRMNPYLQVQAALNAVRSLLVGTSFSSYLPIRSTERQICAAVLHCEGDHNFLWLWI